MRRSISGSETTARRLRAPGERQVLGARQRLDVQHRARRIARRAAASAGWARSRPPRAWRCRGWTSAAPRSSSARARCARRGGAGGRRRSARSSALTERRAACSGCSRSWPTAVKKRVLKRLACSEVSRAAVSSSLVRSSRDSALFSSSVRTRTWPSSVIAVWNSEIGVGLLVHRLLDALHQRGVDLGQLGDAGARDLSTSEPRARASIGGSISSRPLSAARRRCRSRSGSSAWRCTARRRCGSRRPNIPDTARSSDDGSGAFSASRRRRMQSKPMTRSMPPSLASSSSSVLLVERSMSCGRATVKTRPSSMAQKNDRLPSGFMLRIERQ